MSHLTNENKNVPVAKFRMNNSLLLAFQPSDVYTQKIHSLILNKISNLYMQLNKDESLVKEFLKTNKVISIPIEEVWYTLNCGKDYFPKLVTITSGKLTELKIWEFSSKGYGVSTLYPDVEYIKEKHTLEVTLSDKDSSVALLCDIGKNFTLLDMSIISRMESVSALRLYEYIKSNSFTPKGKKDTGEYEIIVSLNELKRILGTAKLDSKKRPSKSKVINLEDNLEYSYKEWDDFKKKVLQPARDEVNKISDSLKIKSLVKIRGTEDIRIITQKIASLQKLETSVSFGKIDVSDIQTADRNNILVSENSMQVVLKAAENDTEKIVEKLSMLNSELSKNKIITNPVGWLVNAIKNDITIEVHTNNFLIAEQRDIDYDALIEAESQ